MHTERERPIASFDFVAGPLPIISRSSVPLKLIICGGTTSIEPVNEIG